MSCVRNISSKTVDGTKYKKLVVHIHPPSNSEDSNSTYLPCSLLKKQVKHSTHKSPRKGQTKKSKHTKQRLTEFYKSYVEEAELLSESLNENRFLNTIVEVNNISNKTKRRFFSKKRSGVNSNSNSNSNSNRVNGIKRKYKLRTTRKHRNKKK